MKKYIDSIVKVSFVLYLSVLFILLFVKYRGFWWSEMSIFDYARMHMNLVPFKTIYGYIEALRLGTMNLNIPLENLLGNLLMFLPMGIYLPYFNKKIQKISKMVMNLIPVLLIIEIAQFLTKRGSFDIDDLILNVCGALLGYCLWNMKWVRKILNSTVTA